MFTKLFNENLEILISNSNVVVSVSNIEQYNLSDQKDKIDSKFIEFTKILRNRFKKLNSFSIYGNYDEKVRKYLMGSTCQIIYGIFRTEYLKKSVLTSFFVGFDWAEMLNIMKFGDVHVLNDVLKLTSSRFTL